MRDTWGALRHLSMKVLYAGFQQYRFPLHPLIGLQIVSDDLAQENPGGKCTVSAASIVR